MDRDEILYAPLEIGHHRVRNRIASTAHGENLAKDGVISDQLAEYHVRRARGGVGLIIAFGSGSVDPDAAYPTSVALWHPGNEPTLTQLASDVHAHGAVLLAQATHRGIRESPSVKGAVVGPSTTVGQLPLCTPHALSIHEIHEIVQRFAEAAARLARCGWDGIEVSSFGTHLIEQFWSPVLNQRADHYGGSFWNRLRFGVEVVAAVAEAVPDDFLIAFRMTGDTMTKELALSVEDMVAIAEAMDGVGRIDLFDISGGSGMNLTTHAASVPTDTFPRSCYNHLSRRIRMHVSVPVLVAGRILDLSDAAEAVASGDCDLVGMTRALIADPDPANRGLAGESARARPCIAINEGCRRVVQGLSLACTVNAAVAEPHLDRITPALRRKKVLVVGGGPAGMEAARVASIRGHDVVLRETEAALGGAVLVAMKMPNRPNLGRHVDWCRRELRAAGVRILTGSAVSIDEIIDESPDVMVIATGAEDVVPPQAAEMVSATTDVAVLMDIVPVHADSNVVVYDAEGHGRGIAAALIASRARARTMLVTPYMHVGEKLEPPNRPAALRDFALAGIVASTSHRLMGAAGNEVLFHDIWAERGVNVHADLAVFVGFRRARTDLIDSCRHTLPDMPVHAVGDCYAPRLLRHAIADGVRTAASL